MVHVGKLEAEVKRPGIDWLRAPIPTAMHSWNASVVLALTVGS